MDSNIRGGHLNQLTHLSTTAPGSVEKNPDNSHTAAANNGGAALLPDYAAKIYGVDMPDPSATSGSNLLEPPISFEIHADLPEAICASHNPIENERPDHRPANASPPSSKANASSSNKPTVRASAISMLTSRENTRISIPQITLSAAPLTESEKDFFNEFIDDEAKFRDVTATETRAGEVAIDPGEISEFMVHDPFTSSLNFQEVADLHSTLYAVIADAPLNSEPAEKLLGLENQLELENHPGEIPETVDFKFVNPRDISRQSGDLPKYQALRTEIDELAGKPPIYTLSKITNPGYKQMRTLLHQLDLTNFGAVNKVPFHTCCTQFMAWLQNPCDSRGNPVTGKQCYVDANKQLKELPATSSQVTNAMHVQSNIELLTIDRDTLKEHMRFYVAALPDTEPKKMGRLDRRLQHFESVIACLRKLHTTITSGESLKKEDLVVSGNEKLPSGDDAAVAGSSRG